MVREDAGVSGEGDTGVWVVAYEAVDYPSSNCDQLSLKMRRVRESSNLKRKKWGGSSSLKRKRRFVGLKCSFNEWRHQHRREVQRYKRTPSRTKGSLAETLS
ncbi:hypothetical protein TNCV_1672741 [Trichonephila clavipes]|nr:hypothetical protein TNCV_1672741 [Trichonephila clavipes]